MKKDISELTWFDLFLVAGLIVCLFSCNSKAYRATQAIKNGYGLDSVAADKKAKEIAPCVTLSQDTTLVHDTVPQIVYDTTTVVVDSLVTLPCPDGSIVSTKIKYITTTIRTTRTITNTYYITKTVEDKGKDMVIRDKDRDIEKKEKKIKFFTAWAMISTMLFLISVIILFIKKSLK